MQTDRQYIERILNSGSEAAVFGLVQKYENQVFNLCFRILRKRELTEEVAQDVFLKALKKLPKLEDTDKFGGWLMRIAYRSAIDEVRKNSIETSSLELAEHIEDEFFQTPAETLEGLNRDEAIERLLSELPKIENAIISLFYIEGYSVREVAEITGLSKSNVKIKLMRTRELLKSRLIKRFGNETKNLY